MQEEQKKGRKLFLAIMLVSDIFIAGIFFVISPAEFTSMIPFLLVVLGFLDGLLLAIMFFSSRHAKKVDEKWGALAERMGWDYSLNITFTQPNGRSEKRPGILGKYAGRDISITEFIPPGSESHAQTMAAARLNKAPKEQFLVRRKVIPLGGGQFLSKEFDRRYAVDTKDKEYAKKVLTSIQGKIISAPMPLTLHAGGSRALALAPGTLTDEKKIMQLLNVLVSLAEAVEKTE